MISYQISDEISIACAHLLSNLIKFGSQTDFCDFYSVNRHRVKSWAKIAVNFNEKL